jgi:hypothetical protein
MLVWLATLLAVFGEQVAYECQLLGAEEGTFILSFQKHNDEVSDVLVIQAGPRMIRDQATRWRGRIVADGIQFSYSEKHNGLQQLGKMTLSAPSSEEGRAKLTWSTTVFGAAFLDSGPKSAECLLIQSADRIGDK